MELKVWVDGVERTISGLTPTTTCQEIIYALAHAIRQKGRFVLVERWRSAERSLAPADHPLELLAKWGEHADEINFVLKHLDQQHPTTIVQQQQHDVSMNSLRSNASSSASSIGRRIPRPPPPAYDQLIAAGGATASSTSNTNNRVKVYPDTTDSGSRSYQWPANRRELELMIASQERTIDAQNTRLQLLDASSSGRDTTTAADQSTWDELNREMAQLERQQANLRSVLAPMRQHDWPSRESSVTNEHHRLQAAIDRIKARIENVTKMIGEQRAHETKLTGQLRELQQHDEMIRREGVPSINLQQ